jgi:hypothetical protein
VRVVYGGHLLRLLADTHRTAAYRDALCAALRGGGADSDGWGGGCGDGNGGCGGSSSSSSSTDRGVRGRGEGGGGGCGGEEEATGGDGCVCMVLGDGHWLALEAVEAGAQRVVDVEGTVHGLRLATEAFVAAHLSPARVRVWQVGLSDQAWRGGGGVRCEGREGEGVGGRGRSDTKEGGRDDEMGAMGLGAGKVSVVVADPFFVESHVGAFAGGGGTQWNNLKFWSHVHALQPLLQHGGGPARARVVPCGARVVAVAVEFKSLRNSQVCICIGVCGSGVCSVGV